MTKQFEENFRVKVFSDGGIVNTMTYLHGEE
jgi:hypothetical protein